MVQWTAEKDQIILKGIFKFHDIKNSAALLDYLAKEIGNDCTPKAVSHRLNNIRSGGGTRTNGSNANTPKQPTTPRGRTKATPRQKSASSDSNPGPEGTADDDEELQSPSAARGKRAANKTKVSYTEQESEAEDDDHGMRKRVKTGPTHTKDTSFDADRVGELSEDEV